MDEPLSNLDAKLRLEMRTEIRRLHQDLGLTTVFVTHDQHEALSLADRIVILSRGVVEQVGTPAEVYTEPQTDFVASFMGYRNALTGDVVGSQGQQTTVAVGDLRLVGTCPGTVPTGSAVVRIRPDDLMICDGGEPGPNRIPLLVEVVEYGGREFVVEGVAPAGQRLYFMASEAPRLGDSVVVAVEPEKVRVFSPTEEGR
ncbi:MAG: TOBE domain-containing protein [Nocardioidaceae bacterium]